MLVRVSHRWNEGREVHERILEAEEPFEEDRGEPARALRRITTQGEPLASAGQLNRHRLTGLEPQRELASRNAGSVGDLIAETLPLLGAKDLGERSKERSDLHGDGIGGHAVVCRSLAELLWDVLEAARLRAAVCHTSEANGRVRGLSCGAVD